MLSSQRILKSDLGVGIALVESEYGLIKDLLIEEVAAAAQHNQRQQHSQSDP